MLTVSETVGHTPLELVHTNKLSPVVKLLTVELLRVAEATLPPPEITDHTPEPVTGLTAFKLAEVTVRQNAWSEPALAAEGKSSTVIFKVLLEEGHVPLEVVHTKELIPTFKLVTAEAFKVGVVMEAPLPTTDHIPVPMEGILEFKVALEAQMVKSVPAFEIVGSESTKIETVLVEAGQTPFTTDHSKILIPVVNEVTPEELSVEVVTADPPDNTDQVPIPTIGILAFNVALGEQMTWLAPALDGVGSESTKILTVSVEFGQEP
jgi:hypothetical protein